MEIKILCPCGAKFKFGVEPVNNQMPVPICCPVCGADATAEANSIILQASPAIDAEAPVAQEPPVALRISRSEPSAPPSVPEPSYQAYQPSPVVSKKENSSNPFRTAVTIVLLVACLGYSGYRFVNKWQRRVGAVSGLATAVGEAGAQENESQSGPKNLWYDKCAILFIKHTNYLEVAESCKAYWKENLHKDLRLSREERDYMAPGDYELIPARNGYVRLLGAFQWPPEQQESLAQLLSQQFGTLVFEWRSESFADTYHFGVYELGNRKFHAQMDVKINGNDIEEIVTTEHDEFAVQNGFKPGPDGFKNFHVLDADRITQKLGMKIWDEAEGAEPGAVFLVESVAAKQ